MPEGWDPALYLSFADERTRPARDLLAQVPLRDPGAVVDMGCGPGNSTELLVARFPSAKVLGLDTSTAMLEEAAQRVPHASFAAGDAATWLPDGDVQLLFANAVYQWVPDHLAVLTRQFRAMTPGAVLAVQMPDNLTEPTHRLMSETADAGPWAERLRGAARRPLPPVSTYYDALAPLADRIELWRTTLHDVLPDPAVVVGWVEGTGLRPFLQPLTQPERTAYLAAYTERIAGTYPPQADGKVLLRFPRLFAMAIRSEGRP